MNIVRIVIAVAGMVMSTTVSAGPCSGASPFTDVTAADSFCSNTEWLKNRGVTLGCTATTYCPGDTVSRAAMALFMNRLADAILPEPIFQEAYIGARLITFFPTQNQHCLVNIPDANHPRIFSVTGSILAQSSSGLNTLEVHAMYTDGGPLTLISTMMGTVDNTTIANIPVTGVIKLGPGPKTFQLVMNHNSLVPDFTILFGRCQIRVDIQSSTGSTSPY